MIVALNCRPIAIHVLLTITFGISEFTVNGNIFPANETCLNVSDGIICYFKASDDLMDWNKARRLCRSFNSTLPVIRNENDQAAVSSYIRSNIDNTNIWTAGKNFTYGTWTWINGESYKGFVEEEYEQPYEMRDHAALETDLTFTSLHEFGFDELPYICQYEAAHCKFSSDVNVNKKCLRLIGDSRSWYDARNQCLMTKGDLAVIGSAELGFLKQLKLNQSYWVGLKKKSFRWTLDDDVGSNDEIKYTNWDTNAYAPYGECITIGASEGRWKSLGCNELRTVVCQRVLDQGVTSAASTVTTFAEAINPFLFLDQDVTSPASTADTSAETINTFLFTYAVIVTICLVVVLIIIVAFIVRKPSIIASKRDTAENPRYQDLKTTQKQANPDETYAEIKLQPLYEEVCQRGN